MTKWENDLQTGQKLTLIKKNSLANKQDKQTKRKVSNGHGKGFKMEKKG